MAVSATAKISALSSEWRDSAAKMAWVTADRYLNGWRPPGSVVTLSTLVAAFPKEFGQEKRMAAVQAWTCGRIYAREKASETLLARANDLGLDTFSLLAAIQISAADVAAAHNDSTQARTALTQRMEQIRACALRLSELVDGSLLDQPPTFYFTHEEAENLAKSFLQSTELAHAVAPLARIYETLAASLAPTSDVRRKSKKTEFLEQLERTTLDDTFIFGALAMAKLPRLALILGRVAVRTEGAEPDPDFGKNPKAKRAPRKAFAKKLRTLFRARTGKPHVCLIVSIVAILFGEQLDSKGVFK